MTRKLIAETRIRYKDTTYETGNSFLCDDEDVQEMLWEGLAKEYPKPSPEVLAKLKSEEAKQVQINELEHPKKLPQEVLKKTEIIQPHKISNPNRKISIVIPTYGQEELTEKCITSIKYTSYFQKEIIVVDDGYGTKYNGVINLKHLKNKGFSAAINKGIKGASSNYIFIVNSDVFVYPECLKEMVFALDNHADIVGAKLLYPDNTIQHAGVRYFRNYLFIHYYWHKAKGGDDPLYCFVTGALMAFKKSIIEDIGYFSNKLFMSYEDVDFCCRAKKKGYKILYWPYARAIHLEGATRKSVTQKELDGTEYFKKLYTEEELKELCAPSQF